MAILASKIPGCSIPFIQSSGLMNSLLFTPSQSIDDAGHNSNSSRGRSTVYTGIGVGVLIIVGAILVIVCYRNRKDVTSSSAVFETELVPELEMANAGIGPEIVNGNWGGMEYLNPIAMTEIGDLYTLNAARE
jgi:hypothetical protein